jgi:hypothetical protein
VLSQAPVAPKVSTGLLEYLLKPQTTDVGAAPRALPGKAPAAIGLARASEAVPVFDNRRISPKVKSAR